MHDVNVVDHGFIGSFQAPHTCNMLFLHIIILSVVLYKENITSSKYSFFKTHGFVYRI